MKLQRMDHVGVIVRDFAAAKAFFLDLGLEVRGEGELEDARLDRIVGLNGARTTFAMLGVPGGQTNIELITFHAPADESDTRHLAANAAGIRHLAFVVEDIEAVIARLERRGAEPFSAIQEFEGSYRLCYLRGPEGIIIELAEAIG